MNVLHFFGHKAVSMGIQEGEGLQVMEDISGQEKRCKRLVFEGDRLVGASFLDIDILPWVFRYLIRERLDVVQDKENLFQKPKETSSQLVEEAK